jgi:hypothetical protein
VAETAQVDPLEKHAGVATAKAVGIDLALNAVESPHVQGKPFAGPSLEESALPIMAETRAHFITAKRSKE